MTKDETRIRIARLMKGLRRAYEKTSPGFLNPMRERLFQEAMITLMRLHSEAAAGSMYPMAPMAPMAPMKGGGDGKR